MHFALHILVTEGPQVKTRSRLALHALAIAVRTT